MSTTKRLNHIKSGLFSRGLALAKVSVNVGTKMATHAVGNLFTDEQGKADRLKELLISQMEMLTQELGQLKGSLMKVGQMLSMYGEHFLPPEANAFLKSLQSQSPPLKWEAVEKALKKRLSADLLGQLDIEQEPAAAASLGQVHKARRKSDSRVLAMKIQYPGVDRAIDGDLAAMKSIFALSKLLPVGKQYEEIFQEVRQMLHQEVDYTIELKTTQNFKKLLEADSRYIVPEVIPEFSNKRVITTIWEEGVAIDGPEVKALSQARRNAIGVAALELYFRELFEFGAVQTDPHFGNYRVRLGQPDRLVLLDFGAVREISKSFQQAYLEMVRGAHFQKPEQVIQGGIDLGFVRDEDSDEQKALFVELCYLITEPFYSKGTPGVRQDFFDSDGNYDFGKSDLPKRVTQKAPQIAFAFKLRTPPREILFLDRKLGGMFILLSSLGVKTRIDQVVRPYLLTS